MLSVITGQSSIIVDELNVASSGNLASILHTFIDAHQFTHLFLEIF